MTPTHQRENPNDSMLPNDSVVSATTCIASYPNPPANCNPPLNYSQNEPPTQSEPGPPDALQRVCEDPNLEEKLHAVCKTQ